MKAEGFTEHVCSFLVWNFFWMLNKFQLFYCYKTDKNVIKNLGYYCWVLWESMKHFFYRLHSTKRIVSLFTAVLSIKILVTPLNIKNFPTLFWQIHCKSFIFLNIKPIQTNKRFNPDIEYWNLAKITPFEKYTPFRQKNLLFNF